MTDEKTGPNAGSVLARQVHYTADLLRSLQESINRLRRTAETLREQLETEGADEVTGAKAQVGKLETLIRDCQKVERLLAEQSSDFAKMLNAENQLDVDAARREVESRLAGIRATLSDPVVPG